MVRVYSRLSKFLVLINLCLLTSAAMADVTIRSFSPQGEVQDANRATAVFTADMVKLGATGTTEPFTIQCPISGTSRWTDPHTWTYSISRDLDPGERCQFKLKPNLKALNGEGVSGQTDYSFQSPGPWIVTIQPFKSARIEEDQVFVVQTRTALKADSVLAHAWCEAEGIGERIPVKMLESFELEQILNSLHWGRSDTVIGLQCSQTLPPGAKVKLVWGRGIEDSNGAKVQEDDAVNYEVRVPFRAELTCDREKPTSPCSALSDLRLQFTDQIDIKLAEQIQLMTPKGVQSPRDVSPERREQLIAQNKKLYYLKNKLSNRDHVDTVVFKGPFTPNTPFTIKLPKSFTDLSGRELSNGKSFPLKTQIGALPPLAKFAADFGILELKEGGVLPVTLRNVESQVSMRVLRQTDASSMMSTWQALDKFEQQTINIPRAKKPLSRRTLDGDENTEEPASIDMLYARELSYLNDKPQAHTQTLPKLDGKQSFEVIGIPLTKPGFYVVEIESKILGTALLRYSKPLYVRSRVLVTDMAVHLKKGRDNSLVWVTSLSSGKPVKGAEVAIYDCKGKSLWQGRTDAQGRGMMNTLLPAQGCDGSSAWFVTAKLGDDFSFVRSDWNRGIEAWRFNVDTWSQPETQKIHTIVDRTLLRAGETVSMKHIARIPHADGYRYPDPKTLPQSLTIELQGGDTSISLPLKWDARGVATTSWHIPDTAKIGTYTVKIGGGWMPSAEFRVSEFRLPTFKGAIQPDKPRYANPSEIPLQLSLAYLNGGVAGGQQVQVSSLMTNTYINFPQYREFSFGIYGEGRNELHELIADKQAVTLDKQGSAKFSLATGKVSQPSHVLAEMTFSDPSGEIHTIAGETDLWPSAVAVGARVIDWVSLKGKHRIEAVALNIDGKPRANVPVSIAGSREWTYVHRKRILGGFYSYENEEHSEDLGEVCKGVTNSLGLFNCELEIAEEGNIKLRVSGEDAQGNTSEADTSFYASGKGEVWFDQADEDRMDVIPEKREYMPGDKARFQVHTPFHASTALISVEREGIVSSFVQLLYRRDAVIEIPVGNNWGPNVYVSVLAVRGRLTEVPWYSFFQWGWHSPADWWQSWRTGVPAPQATVDLARPAFKFGLTRIDVGNAGVRLQVDVTADKSVYHPRAQATIKVKVHLPNGKPAPAGSEVAIAAVDRALLELASNSTWNLLDSMQQERAYLVETATAQMQVVGKRHFGKKALPAGGGGGKLSARELFDTLLYWNPRVKLDKDGMATVKVPLNDSLTAFKIVAIADVNADLFGTGETEITSTQDVQLTSGLPPLVREGDSYRAMLSVRNTTDHAMQLTLQGQAGRQLLPKQALKLEAGSAQEVAWQVSVPSNAESLPWQIEAKDDDGKVQDRIRLTQKIQPKVPVTVQQASFMRLEKDYSVPATLQPEALPGKGGVEVRLTARLADQTAGLQRYFNQYPFSCLEQKVSIASGLNDAQRWADINRNLDGYLDAQGFLQYFPGSGQGSEALTAYVLAMAYESGIKLPPNAEDKMQKALFDFVEGRAKGASWLWGEREYLPERRLSALEALSHTGKVTGRMLTPFEFKPIKMATITLIDWYSLLKRVPDAAQREQRLKQAERELRNRMQYVGGRLVFTTEAHDYWWWLMVNGEVNALRLAALVVDDPAWQADMPALVRGALLRQSQGHWSTTIANVWGGLALARFGQRFEHEAVSGVTTAKLQDTEKRYQWPIGKIDKTVKAPVTTIGGDQAQLQLPWPAAVGDYTLSLNHEGSGKPWVNLFVTAAVPGVLVENGFRIKRRIEPVEQKVLGQWTRGDLVRVRIDVDSDQSMSWVALSDPIPGGASILGNTARDSAIAQDGENDYRNGHNDAYPSYTERGLGFFRAYYNYVPKGKFWYEYTLRLNNPGEFSLPPTRVDAMYAPEIFGQLPNENLSVKVK